MVVKAACILLCGAPVVLCNDGVALATSVALHTSDNGLAVALNRIGAHRQHMLHMSNRWDTALKSYPRPLHCIPRPHSCLDDIIIICQHQSMCMDSTCLSKEGPKQGGMHQMDHVHACSQLDAHNMALRLVHTSL